MDSFMVPLLLCVLFVLYVEYAEATVGAVVAKWLGLTKA